MNSSLSDRKKHHWTRCKFIFQHNFQDHLLHWSLHVRSENKGTHLFYRIVWCIASRNLQSTCSILSKIVKKILFNKKSTFKYTWLQMVLFFSMLQPRLLFHYGNYDFATKELSSLKIWVSSSMAHELQTFVQIFINEHQHLIYYHRYICMWWKSVSDASFITGAPHTHSHTHTHTRN